MPSGVSIEKHMRSGISLGKLKKKKKIKKILKKKPLRLIFCRVLDFLLNRHQKNTFWEAFLNNTSYETGRITMKGFRLGIGM